MKKRMPYWLYKAGYTEFKARDYDAKKKTIEVELPDYKRPMFPDDWRNNGGNRYHTPNGCTVTGWGSGLSEHFEVEHYVTIYNCPHKSFGPGIGTREQVMEYVNSFDRKEA